jgi:hypothetical protein
MINPQYLDVGAGISIAGGRVYITMDAGWPSGAYPLPTHQTWTPEGTPGQFSSLAFEPIFVSTPLPDGSLYHVVGYGQSLIGIAGAYGMSVTDLATINNINPDQIYAGQKLIIHRAATPSPTAQSTEMIPVIIPTQEIAASPTASPVPESPPSPPLSAPSAMRVSGIIIIGVCVLVALILLNSKRR